MAFTKVRPAVKDGLLNIGTSMLSTLGKSAAYFIGPALLTPRDFGTYAYLSWLATIAALLGATGFVQAAQRFSCQVTEDRRKFSSLLLRLSILLTSVVAAVLLWTPGTVKIPLPLALVAMVFAIASSVYLIEQALLQARRNFLSPLRAEAGSQLARLLGLAALKLTGNIAANSLLYLDAFMNVLKVFMLKVRNKEVILPEGATASRSINHRELLTYSSSIFLISLLDVLLWQRGEMFFLGRYSTLAVVGQFALASQLSQLIVLAPSAAITSLLPRLSEKAYSDASKLDEATSRILTLAIVSAIPLYSVSILIAPLILKLWKPEYLAVGSILPALMIGKLALLLSAPLSLALYASGRQRTVLAVVCIAGAFALVTDFGLIKTLGLNGAAWASALNQSLTGLGTYAAARQSMKLRVNLSMACTITLFILVSIQIPAAMTEFRGLIAALSLFVAAAAVLREPIALRHLPSARIWLQTRKLVRTNA